MGSFYTQIIVREANSEKIATVMRNLNLSSFVIPASGSDISVVCEREIENQDIDVLDTVAANLSNKLGCAAIGLLNHDDDWLVLRYFNSGKYVGRLQIGHTPISLRGSIFKLRKLLNPNASLLGLISTFILPFIFQWRRHEKLVALIGIPPQSVAVGYRYIQENNFLVEFDKSDLIET
jgi:hypothetical protein